VNYLLAIILFAAGFGVMFYGLTLSGLGQKNPQKAAGGGFLIAIGIAVMLAGSWVLGQ